jgi:hypothetical protein
MDENDAARLVDDFTHLRLPKARWTHEAHLVVCRATLRLFDPAAALDRLRQAIRSYNEASGTANTDTGGYHETLTAYYVGAVHAVGPVSLDELVSHPACARGAPGSHWSRERLFSVTARRTWVPPDLAPVAGWSPDGARAAGR